jgi:hypothetical protein
MIDIAKYIFLQLIIFVYQFTSLNIWGLDLKEMAQNTRDYVVNSPIVHVVEFILVPIVILLFIGIVNIARRHRELYEKLITREAAPTQVQPETAVANRWQDIMRYIESVREGEWKFAVIEADNLVDDVLKNMFAGETMGERLMIIDKTQLLTIDGLWEAHKIRNRLAHEPNYFLRHAEAVRAIQLYEQTLKELEILPK